MTSRFVPSVVSDLSDLDELIAMMRGRNIAVLTGAGCSTASGIPDYRGPQTSKKERSPMMYNDFVRSEANRRRYWARSAVGWPHIRKARPNDAHRALAELERRGHLTGVITQNVDRLHSQAGSQEVIELHGALAEVICLDCRGVVCRDEVQGRIESDNPGWTEQCGALAPDGDVELPDQIPADFQIPGCTKCGGILKPKVVFFGENVAKPIVDRAWKTVGDADFLLVIGSSLTVFSGYRFVRGADREGKPVAIINLGKTRGDEHACLRVPAHVEKALGAICQRL